MFALFETLMYTFLVPVNAGLKVNASVSVKLPPASDTDEVPASTAHWLLLSVPGVPNGAEPTYPLPESCTSTSWLVVRVYCTKHVFGAAISVLNRIPTKLISAALE